MERVLTKDEVNGRLINDFEEDNILYPLGRSPAKRYKSSDEIKKQYSMKRFRDEIKKKIKNNKKEDMISLTLNDKYQCMNGVDIMTQDEVENIPLEERIKFILINPDTNKIAIYCANIESIRAEINYQSNHNDHYNLNIPLKTKIKKELVHSILNSPNKIIILVFNGREYEDSSTYISRNEKILNMNIQTLENLQQAFEIGQKRFNFVNDFVNDFNNVLSYSFGNNRRFSKKLRRIY